MNKMILNNRTEIEFLSAIGMNISVNDITIDELEEKLTDENLSCVEFTTSKGEVYGKYNDLELINISKNYKTKEITIILHQKRY